VNSEPDVLQHVFRIILAAQLAGEKPVELRAEPRDQNRYCGCIRLLVPHH
jgi:hypothetical protein